MAAFVDEQCPRRGPALSHTMNGDSGSRCIHCGTVIYLRTIVRRAVAMHALDDCLGSKCPVHGFIPRRTFR